MDDEIRPIPESPTNIKTAYYYRLKRRLEEAVGLPRDKTFAEWFGIDYGAESRGDASHE